MNKTAKGRRNQNKVKKFLESCGFQCEVAKFSRWGSTDFYGLFDIIAISPQQIKLIQVKSNRSNKAQEEAISLFACPKEISKEMWIIKDRIRNPIIKYL